MSGKPLPAHEELLRIFDYDPESGVLKWRISPSPDTRIGDVCGTSRKHHVRYQGSFYRANRVIWKVMTGEDPPGLVDHADTDPLNNKWSNLRIATSSQNGMNRRASSANKLGVKGVHVNVDGSFTTQIRIRHPGQTTGRGKMTYLGRYDTLEDAKTVYALAVRTHHKEFGRTNYVEFHTDAQTASAPVRRTRKIKRTK